MSTSWGAFLQDADPRAHGVQVYRHVDELAASVCDYLASGFDHGEPAVVIARPAHWTGFADRLAARGWESDALAESGLLWLLDCDLTL